jgi:uncharacterized membrane protein
VLKRLPFVPGPFGSRPRLTLAIGLAVLAGAALALIPNPFEPTTRSILTWDFASGFFVASTLWGMRGRDTQAMRTRAAFEDEGGAAILALVLIATAFSLGAVAAELRLAQTGDGLEKTLRVGLAFGTVALSWTFVHLIFALHYAHEFYAPARQKGTATRGGLVFPGDQTPDYWDFLHFSMIIGVAAQTADIQISSKTLRRISTAHSVTAFGFNTVVLALTINLLASLF